MKAILLAAGVGTRISRMIEQIPKSTLPINGKPLIRMTAEKLLSLGLDVIVVVGYKKEKIYEALKGLNVKYYFNPFFSITNSIASLWFAREEIDGDILIMNADVFVSSNIIRNILDDPREKVMSIDYSRTKTGDYFFSTAENGVIKKYGKDLPLEERTCEYVGVAKINSKFADIFKGRMDQLINKGKFQLWWENIMYSFAEEIGNEVYTLDVKGEFWSEIDYFDDYERILNYINSLQNEVHE